MRVGFMADLLYYRLAAGTTRYCVELLKGLDNCGVDYKLFSLYPQETIQKMASERGFPTAFSAQETLPRQLRYLLWHYAGMMGPASHLVEDCDLIHTPALLVPPRKRKPLIVTVHDITFRLYRQHHSLWSRTLAESGLRASVYSADAIITDSRSTADNMLQYTAVKKQNLYVVPLAADAKFAPKHDEAVLKKHGLESPYFLTVGTLEPRKNLPLVIEAMATLARPGVKLAVVGARGWMETPIFERVQQLGLQDTIQFTGYVSDEELPVLMSMATGFVYPSLYEGFGLPVLEAMQCGAPVITSNSSSLPEVAGKAAIMIKPDDSKGLVDAMQLLLDSQAKREELSGLGLERSRLFTWQKTAEMTRDVYQTVLDRG